MSTEWIEELVGDLSKRFFEKTGKKLDMMRTGKIAQELFWANNQKN